VLGATVATVLLLALFRTAADIFLLLFIAILISLYLGAVADVFAARLRIPRKLALAIAVLLSGGAVVGLFFLLVPPVVEQTQQLVKVLPNYIKTWEAGITRIAARYPELQAVWGSGGDHQLVTAIYDEIKGPVASLVPKVVSLAQIGIDVVSVCVMGLYLALYPGLYREWLIALFPPIQRDLMRDVLGDLASTLRSWIVGQMLAMFILAILTAIGLYVLQVPYSLTFGVFTGAVAIIPFFGTLVSTLVPALFVLGGDGIGAIGPAGHALLVVLLGVIIHVIEGNLVIPLITAKRVELPPVLTIMAVLVMGKLLGAIGLLVAVPSLAAIMVVVRRILINRIYEGQGFRRVTRDRALVLRVPAPDGGVLVANAPDLDIVSFAERAA
jgi:predicted PurR-regulated permease PerM